MKRSYVDFYCENNNRELKKIVDSILIKNFPWIPQKYYDDFYSNAELVCWDCQKRYDGRKPFEKFLINCLYNKIKTQVTRMNRQKRVGDLTTESLHKRIGQDDSDMMLQDVIEDVSNTDVNDYMMIKSAVDVVYSFTKPREKKILSLLQQGFSNKEIAVILHIEPKTISDLKRKLNDNSCVRRAVKKAGYLGGFNDEV